MELLQIAKLLGLTIKESEQGKKLDEARKAYESDPHIVALTTEFEVQQKALAAVMGGKDADSNIIDAVQSRLNEIYDEVLATEVYKNYEAAQNELNALMDQVNSTVMQEINGVPSDGCTHNCSTCGGCH